MIKRPACGARRTGSLAAGPPAGFPRRSSSAPAALFPGHQLLVGAGAHHAAGLHPQELCRDLGRLWRRDGQHAADRACDRRADHVARLRLRLCHPLPCGTLRQRAAVPDADHAVRRLSGEDLCLEEHPGPRRHPQPVLLWPRPHRRAARRPASTAPTASSSRSPISCCLSPSCRSTATCAPSADATIEAARDLGAGALGGAARHRPAAMREGHRRRLPVRLPDFGRRLRDAALRRRRRGDDGAFHRDAILLRLQLADGQRHGLHRHGACRWR